MEISQRGSCRNPFYHVSMFEVDSHLQKDENLGK